MPGQQQPYYSPPPQVQIVRKVHWASIVLFGLGGIMFAIGIAAAGGSSPQTAASPSPYPVYISAGPAGPVPTTAKAAPAPPAPVHIDDGTWTVGTDMPAGSYRTTANVGADCYWAILKSGSNGADIIANDIPGGGRPTVTLKAGQDFQSRDCGTWAKIR